MNLTRLGNVTYPTVYTQHAIHAQHCFSTSCLIYSSFTLASCSELVASYPGLPMFFNIHKKNQEGLADFGDVMDVVCDDAHWNE